MCNIPGPKESADTMAETLLVIVEKQHGTEEMLKAWKRLTFRKARFQKLWMVQPGVTLMKVLNRYGGK